jgi:trigger factor
VKYEVKPEFELKDISGIEVEKFVHAATDEEVNNEIERLQQINATFEEAQKVEGEDFVVTADIVDFDEQGNLLEKSKRENMRITLREKTTEKEIKEALQGVSVGDVKDVKFEHQHGDHSHKIHLQITVKKIERLILPAMDDELAKKVSNGKFQTIAEMRDNIKKDLADFWLDRSNKRFENDLLEAIVKQYEFTVPTSVVNNLLDTYVEEVKNQQPGKTLPKNFNEKQYRESYKNIAEWQGKWLLIKEAMSEKENITITDDDIASVAEKEAAKLGIDKERLISYYKSSEQATERIKYDRLIDILKRSVKIKETETDDYSKFSVQ